MPERSHLLTDLPSTPSCMFAVACTLLSAFGVFLLALVGLLLKSGSPFVGKPALGRDNNSSADACFAAAGLYVVIGLVSFASLRRADRSA